jgi:uncharacterized protein YjbI with pentapeptide repeats
MLYRDQLRILEQGVEKWNAWRQDNPDVVPQLEGVDLTEADLTNINLRGAKMISAILNYANLSGADLSDSNLRVAEIMETNLRGANLSGADLSYAKLENADLSGANLSNTVLTETNFRASDLTEAHFNDAFLYETDFQYAVLINIEATPDVMEVLQQFKANPDHLQLILSNDITKWNEWRQANPNIKPVLSHADLSRANLSYANLSDVDLSRANLRQSSLSDADLSGADLSYADLSETNLVGANLSWARLAFADLSRANMNFTSDREDGSKYTRLTDAYLYGANLSGAKMDRAILPGADLTGANLQNANLVEADLYNADLIESDLAGADLTGADLSRADLVDTNFTDAKITGCRIYGISAWNVIMDKTVQNDLVISSEYEPVVTVDNLEVGQFIYLMLNNTKIRDVINTITSKGVLILGRFSDPQRKSVLDGLREKLREFDLLPIVFDFDRPTDKDYTETVQTLAGMSMFVIADVTNPKSTPLELEATAKQFKIPFIPIIDISVDPYPFAMLVDLQKSYHWVLPTLQYETKDDLLDDENLKTYIIDRAVAKRQELRTAKSQEPEPILIRKKSAATPPS